MSGIEGATVTVPEGALAFVDHPYETASWYDVLVPVPGTYPLEKAEGGRYTAAVACRRVETYRVNRLLSYSTDDLKVGLDEPVTYHVRLYAFQIGRPCTVGDGWQVTPARELVAS